MTDGTQPLKIPWVGAKIVEAMSIRTTIVRRPVAAGLRSSVTLVDGNPVTSLARRNEALRRYAMSKNEIASEARLPEYLQNSPLSALKQALQGHNYPKGVKEAILQEIRRKEAQEGIDSKRYNGGMNEDG